MWYIEFLESHIKETWLSLLQPVLMHTATRGKYPNTEFPSDEVIATTFELLAVIVASFKKNRLALTDIVDEVYNKGMLVFTDPDRAAAHRLVFAAVGWISKSSINNLSDNRKLTKPNSNSIHTETRPHSKFP